MRLQLRKRLQNGMSEYGKRDKTNWSAVSHYQPNKIGYMRVACSMKLIIKEHKNKVFDLRSLCSDGSRQKKIAFRCSYPNQSV